MPNADDFLSEIDAALRTYDRARVAQLCTDAVDRARRGEEVFAAAPAGRLLDALRRKRHFDLMLRVGDAFLEYGPDEPKIRRHYAQALIESGRMSAAIAVLRELLGRDGVDANERREARGLLGRTFKELYVDAAPIVEEVQRRHLRTAVSWYAEVYDEDPSKARWHGINLVALVERASRDGVELPASIDAKGVAAQILRAIEDSDASSPGGPALCPWDLATAAEACLALGRSDEAASWLGRYVAAGVDAFELASTRRQLLEVWQLERGGSPGRELLALLDAALLDAEGGALVLAPAQIETAAKSMEVLGAVVDGPPVATARVPAKTRFSLHAAPREAEPLDERRYKSLCWYATALERARLVARILDGHGTAIGSGFLIHAVQWNIPSQSEWLLITNQHVLSSMPRRATAIRPEQARIRFEACPPVDEFRVDAPILEQRLAPFDATIVPLLGQPPRVSPYRIASPVPDARSGERVWIIGYPRGGELGFSLHDNTVIDRDDRYLHYRAPTDPGSSGSPVWNERWELVALHHAGGDRMPRLNSARGGFYAANEGVSILAILAAIGVRAAHG